MNSEKTKIASESKCIAAAKNTPSLRRCSEQRSPGLRARGRLPRTEKVLDAVAALKAANAQVEDAKRADIAQSFSLGLF